MSKLGTPKYFYHRHNLKHATGFITPIDKQKLKALAKANDRSEVRYVTRVIEKHIREKEKEGKLRKVGNKWVATDG